MLRFHFHHLAGNTDHRGMSRHRCYQNRAGADPAMTSDDHRTEDGGAAKNRHGIFDGRMAVDALRRRAAKSDALVNRHLVANLGGLADNHAHAVIDEESSPYGRAGVNLDTGEKSSH